MNNPGYVYVLSNPSFKEGLYKIGVTRREVRKRAKELFTTGVPDEFVIEYKEFFKDSKRAEIMVQSWLILNMFSYRLDREFFTAPLNVIIQKIKEEKLKETNENFPIDPLHQSSLFEFSLDEINEDFESKSNGNNKIHNNSTCYQQNQGNYPMIISNPPYLQNNLVSMIIHLMKSETEIIFDPYCGSGGFLNKFLSQNYQLT